MNQTTRLSQYVQQKPSPLSRPSQGPYKSQESSKNNSQNRKKSGGSRYSKQYNFEIENMDDKRPHRLELTTEMGTGFFFKGQQKISPLPFNQVRKSPSFRVRQQMNQSNDSRFIDHNSDSSTSKLNKSSRSDNLNRQDERVNRIEALENYVKDNVNELPQMQNTQPIATKLINTNVTSLQNTHMSTKPHSNSVTKAFESSILDDLEANIEEMHFYFVEFQQKSKQWMTKIETKHKKT